MDYDDTHVIYLPVPVVEQKRMLAQMFKQWVIDFQPGRVKTAEVLIVCRSIDGVRGGVLEDGWPVATVYLYTKNLSFSLSSPLEAKFKDLDTGRAISQVTMGYYREAVCSVASVFLSPYKALMHEPARYGAHITWSCLDTNTGDNDDMKEKQFFHALRKRPFSLENGSVERTNMDAFVKSILEE